MPTRVTVRVYREGETRPQTFTGEKPETADPRDLEVRFNEEIPATKVEIEVLSIRDKEPAHVHVWEMTLW